MLDDIDGWASPVDERSECLINSLQYWIKSMLENHGRPGCLDKFAGMRTVSIHLLKFDQVYNEALEIVRRRDA